MTIDPGINHLGLTLSLIDFQNKTIIESYTTTIHVKEKNLNKENIEKYGLRQCKIDYMNELLIKYIEKYNPITVVVESPFYNIRRPAAFLPLVELLYQIRITIRNYDNINYVSYEPSIIKKTIGASAICKKDEVRKYVLIKEDFFKLKQEVSIQDLDEHSIDSLAILYTHFEKVIKNI